ncbi:MAG: MauE/DoxX family redox-associated membrane protein [Smithellaceae bacterium]
MKQHKFFDRIIPITSLVCRLALGFLFFYAGVGKIISPQEFAVAIYNYQLLPDGTINLLAVVLPWLEVLLAAALVAGFYVRGASLLSAALFFVFAVALSINLIRGLDISCGCFSAAGESINWLYVVRDAGLLALSVFVLFFDRGWRCLAGPSA